MNAPTANTDRSLLETLLLFALAVLTCFVLIGHLRIYIGHGTVPEDLGAFYCAGSVVLHRQDPYRVQPLLDCERTLGSVDPRWNSRMQYEGVNAAPLPAYDFLPLALLAKLPVRAAVMVFGALLFCVTVVVGYCVARMSALPLAVAFATVFVGIVYEAAPYGQIAPFAIAAVAAAALLMRLGKQEAAALAASASLLQPLFGLPVVMAMFAFVPRARLVIGAGAVALFLGAAAAVGMQGIAEYIAVLKTQARAELNAPFQYSLTWLLHALGASGPTALLIGAISYVVLLVVCLLVLSRSRQRAIQTGAVVLLPAAFAVFGGTYVHLSQMGVALLAAIVLVPQVGVALGSLIAAALLIVPFAAIKFTGFTTLPPLVLMAATVWCAVFFLARARGSRAAAVTASCITVLALLLAAGLIAIRPANEAVFFKGITLTHQADAIASVESEYVNDVVASLDRTPLWHYLLLKLPTWLGVGLVLWFGSWMVLTGSKTFGEGGPSSEAGAPRLEETLRR